MNDDTTSAASSNQILAKRPFLGGRLPPLRIQAVGNIEEISSPETIAPTIPPVSLEGTSLQEETTMVTSQDKAPEVETPLKAGSDTSPTATVSPYDSLLPKLEEEKERKKTDLALLAGAVIARLKIKENELTQVKKERLSIPEHISLYENYVTATLAPYLRKERTSFAYAYLTSVLARSGKTLLETSIIFSQKEKGGLAAFTKHCYEERLALWGELKRSSGKTVSAVSMLSLAPLLTFETLAAMVFENTIVLPPKKTIEEEPEASLRGVAQNTPDPLSTVEAAAPTDVIHIGEDIWTIARDELKKLLPEGSHEDFGVEGTKSNTLMKRAVDEIQKNSRAYGIDGGVRILIAGNPIDRKAISDLLKNMMNEPEREEQKEETPLYTEEMTGSKALAAELNTLQVLTSASGGGISAPEQVQASKEEAPAGPSAVDESNKDAVTEIFLDDAFARIVRLVCKVSDTKNLELCFKKYASLTIRDFTSALLLEDPLIKEESEAFLTWSKNSYLKEKVAIFDKLTLVSVLTTVERGVSATLVKTTH